MQPTSSMEQAIEEIKNLSLKVKESKQWDRFVHGDVFHDLSNLCSVHTFRSYVQEKHMMFTLDDVQNYLNFLMRTLANIEIDIVSGNEETIIDNLKEVKSNLHESKKILIMRWTELAYKKCCSSGSKNEYTYHNTDATFCIWITTSERKGKIIFFPGIHIEIAPFLQFVQVFLSNEHNSSRLCEVLHKYPIESLYNQIEEPEPIYDEDDETVPQKLDLPVLQAKKQKKKQSFNTKKGLTSNIEMALKKKTSKKIKKKISIQSQFVVSRVPSVKKGEQIRFNLYADVTPIWKKMGEVKEKPTNGADHKVDFDLECLLGPVYYLSSFETGKTIHKTSVWSVVVETQLTEKKLQGESILISLKIPVEEVFLGPTEPLIAYREENDSAWQKGVFTTHTQFDQNTFVVSCRLSKFGYVGLFQHNDFHYPYKKWSVKFHEKNIHVRLHTSVVELFFIIEDHEIHLDTLSGDEFSKLKSLNAKKMSISEIFMKLESHGVHIIPNDQMIIKHRDTKKDLELEEYIYRKICLNQIDCESCRMNGTLSSDTAVITIDGNQNIIEPHRRIYLKHKEEEPHN